MKFLQVPKAHCVNGKPADPLFKISLEVFLLMSSFFRKVADDVQVALVNMSRGPQNSLANVQSTKANTEKCRSIFSLKLSVILR